MFQQQWTLPTRIQEKPSLKDKNSVVTEALHTNCSCCHHHQCTFGGSEDLAEMATSGLVFWRKLSGKKNQKGPELPCPAPPPESLEKPIVR